MGIRTKIFRGILGLMIIATMIAAPALAQDKPVVGLVMKSLANEFFKTMLAQGGYNIVDDLDQHFRSNRYRTRQYQVMGAPAEPQGRGHQDTGGLSRPFGNGLGHVSIGAQRGKGAMLFGAAHGQYDAVV